MPDKSERLLDLVAVLLEARRPLTADEIRTSFELYPSDKQAFRRTFERDKQELRELGVPIVVAPVPGTDPPETGYRIPPEEYYLRDPGLEPDELAALHLAVDTIRLEGVDPDRPLQKLGGTLGEGGGAASATVPFEAHAGVVMEAIGQGRRVRFRYLDADREVDPLHLHMGRGKWHLQGFDHSRDAIRQFRLDRVEGEITVDEPGSVTVTETPARPQLRGWELGEGSATRALVLIGPAQAAVARFEVGDEAVVETRPDGSVVVALDVRLVDAFRSFVLGYLDDALVLEPPELRADLIDWLTRIAETS